MESLRDFYLSNWLLFAPIGITLMLYGAALGYLLIYAVFIRAAARRAAWAHRERPRLDAELPFVSILKPLCGGDDELDRNLASYALLDYPRLEIICRAETPSDPALAVARQVARRFPHVRFRVLTGSGSSLADEAAVNPKVVQLQAMADVAQGEVLLLCDSNVRIGAMDLRSLVAPFAHRGVGLVFQPFFGEGEDTWGAAIENLRNTEFPGMLCVAAKLFVFQDVVTAKGILVRAEALDAIGGFAPVIEFHNDDHLLAVAVKKAGWKARLAPIPAREIQTVRSVGQTVQRHTRHAAGRWRCCAGACLLEVLLNPVLTGLPLCLIGWPGVAAWGGLALLKFAMEFVAGRVLRGKWLAPRYWLAMPLKDLLMPLLLVRGLFDNRVAWRGIEYRMGAQSRLIPIAGAKPSEAGQSALPGRRSKAAA